MITASHNPAEYNGFKVFDSNGEALGDEGGLHLGKGRKETDHRGRLRGRVEISHTQEYEDRLSELSFNHQWKVVLDPGNGATCLLASRVYMNVLSHVTVINSVPDGAFPARGSEPTQETMKMLGRAVLETGADAGIGFDGDGDRMFMIDEKGICPLQDRVLGFYISYLAQHSKGPFLVPLDASMAIDTVAEKCNATVIRGPVGDAKLLREMRKMSGTFAGEPSGAWIHPQFNPCPDGVLSGLLFLRAVEETQGPVSRTLREVPQYYMLRKSLRINRGISKSAFTFLAGQLRKVIGEGSNIAVKFGLRISSRDSWVLVRQSGTEPVVRVTCESKRAVDTERIMKETVRAVRRALKSRSH